MGLDVGERRIGVALSDPLGSMAFPFSVLERKGKDPDLKSLQALAQEHEVERVVVGMPRSLDGSLGPQARRVQGFVEGLAGSLALPVETWDERLSTVAAERSLVATGMKRGKRKIERDAVAAALILQGYLDRSRGSAS